MRRPRRLVSIAHSYCVALNRRLAHEMSLAAKARWEVTAVAPSFFHGDLRPIALEMMADEPCRLEAIQAYFTKRVHVMLYGRRLRDLLSEGWDVVHCWEEPYIFAGGQVAMWTPERAALVYATFQNISKRYPPPFNLIERYSMNRAAGWIAFGHTIEQTLSRRPVYSDRQHRVIPVGVDVSKFKPDRVLRDYTRARLGWDNEGPPVVGYLGRFVEEKGLRALARALDRVTRPWRALLVGAGPLESFLREWAARSGDRVKVVTGVKHDEAPAYLNAMDLICAPSRTTSFWREQLGRMLIEAFACGVPVITTDSGEIPYVVGDAGIIVSETDDSQLTEALSDLIEDRPRRLEMASRGLDRARSVYAWPIVARQHLSFFDELL